MNTSKTTPKFWLFLIVAICTSYIGWSQVTLQAETLQPIYKTSPTDVIGNHFLDEAVVNTTGVTTLTWHDAPTGGSQIIDPSTEALSESTVYYVESSAASNQGSIRLPVKFILLEDHTVTVTGDTDAGADVNINICNGDDVPVSVTNFIQDTPDWKIDFETANSNLKELGNFRGTDYYTWGTTTTTMDFATAQTNANSIPGATMYRIQNNDEHTAVYGMGIPDLGHPKFGGTAYWIGLEQRFTNNTPTGLAHENWYWLDGTPYLTRSEATQPDPNDPVGNWWQGGLGVASRSPNDGNAASGGPTHTEAGVEQNVQIGFGGINIQDREAGVRGSVMWDAGLILEHSGNSVEWFESDGITRAVDFTVPASPVAAYGSNVVLRGLDDATTTYKVRVFTNSIYKEYTIIINASGSISAPTADASQTFCTADNETVAALVANGGVNVEWFGSDDTVGDTTPLTSTDLLVDGQSYWAGNTGNPCADLTRVEVVVTLSSSAPAATADTAQSFCATDGNTVADLTFNSGTNPEWFASADTVGDTTPLTSTDILVDGQSYWIGNTNTTCADLTRTEVVVTLTAAAPAATAADQDFCETAEKRVLDLIASGTDVAWFDAPTNGNQYTGLELLIDGQSYWAGNTGTCVDETRTEITVTLTDAIAPPSTDDPIQQFCSEDNATIANIEYTGGENVKWYDSEFDGNELDILDNLKTGLYWMGNSGTSCIDTTREAVSVIVAPCDTGDVLNLQDGFSPNDDGNNDEFDLTLLSVFYPDFTVVIYNRWGQKVFTGDIQNLTWNGKLNGDGEALPTGGYYYILDLNTEGKEPIKGTIYISK